MFGAACLIVAPACSVADYEWYSVPGGKLYLASYILDLSSLRFSDCCWYPSYAVCILHSCSICQLYTLGSTSFRQEVSRGCRSICQGIAAHGCTISHQHALQYHSPPDVCASRWPCSDQEYSSTCRISEPEACAATLVAGQGSDPVLYRCQQQTRAADIGFLSGIMEWNLSADSKSEATVILNIFMRKFFSVVLFVVLKQYFAASYIVGQFIGLGHWSIFQRHQMLST